MKFTLNRVVHYYYAVVLIMLVSFFGYGVAHYWSTGVLNIEFVSNLYDGTNRVKIVKDRNDIEEIRKLVDSDRAKDAMKILTRLDQDIKDLKPIKNTEDDKSFSDNHSKFKAAIAGLQTTPELAGILTGITTKVSAFEIFVTEKKWPTLTKMSVNLRNKASQSRIVTGGILNLERVNNLSQSINNDLEAMNNFTQASGLPIDIKVAIENRIKIIKAEADGLNTYIDGRKSFTQVHKEFSTNYLAWFKLVEPEIAFKKMEFEKSSQTLVISIIGMITFFVFSIVLGFIINNYASKRGSEKTEKLILETVRDDLLPIESKNNNKFSNSFNNEVNKYHDYIHRRMIFGSIFQEAMPFASILLDSNLNLVWGNPHFYQEWKLESFKDDDDSLTWDFLQRFTNLEDNSSILSALRLSKNGSYKIQVKTTSMNSSIPYEMHISPVEYAGNKRIMVIFYPLGEVDILLKTQKEAILTPVLTALEEQYNGTITTESRNANKLLAEKNNAGILYRKVFEYVDQKENEIDAKNLEIEKLEKSLEQQRNMVSDVRRLVVTSFETQRSSVEEYNRFKKSVSSLIDSRDNVEEQFKYTMSTSREIYKDQSKIISIAENAEKSVDEYVKSLKTITGLKSEFKGLRNSVEDFKSRIIQVLDQLLVFQNHEGDTLRIDQFLGKIKIEMKGFEKILYDFNQVVTQLDVTVSKIDMMVEGREQADLNSIKNRMDVMKNNIDNVQFTASKLTQNNSVKDDELIVSLKILVGNLKSEMKRIDEMCKLTGLTEEYLSVISPRSENSI